LTHFLLGSTAWKSLKAIQRALFVEVAQRWNGYNNGRIGLGVRDAAEAVHARVNTVCHAFDVLQERGFLELMQDASFRQKKLVREWRVTCFPIGPWDAPTSRATHDYQRWTGAAYGQAVADDSKADPRHQDRRPTGRQQAQDVSRDVGHRMGRAGGHLGRSQDAGEGCPEDGAQKQKWVFRESSG
jgi:hypothetical protein